MPFYDAEVIYYHFLNSLIKYIINNDLETKRLFKDISTYIGKQHIIE